MLKEKQNILLQKNINGVINDALLKEQLTTLDTEIWNIDKTLTQNEERTIDIEAIFKFLDEFLLHPSLTWQNMPLHIKLKLQWFQFPQGVTYDGKQFRTTKVSSIFKLKQFFLGPMSPNVHYTRLYYEHENSANFPALQNKKSIVWIEVEKELKLLDEVLKFKDKT